jgi:nucleoid-associated protein YgaU
MIKQNIGYIISGIIILICLAIIYQKFSYNQKILNDTSSAKTVREEIQENIKESKTSNQKHVIQKGDTLWDLSVKYYGDGTKYHEIIKKNPGKTFKFSDGREGLIYPGTELEI